MDANKVSGGDGRRVSAQDIQLVQNLIERCLQLYMNQKQVVDTLAEQAKIEPGFTNLIWQRLEEQNTDFFKAYHVRLMVKHQIDVFNSLLRKQVDLMQMYPLGVSSSSVLNFDASHPSSFQQPPASYAVIASERMHRTAIPPGCLGNGITSMSRNVHVNGEPSSRALHVATSQNMLVPEPAIMQQGSNGVGHKSEPGCPIISGFPYGDDVNESHLPHHGGFSNVDPDLSILHESFLQSNNDDFLGQFRQNFSLSDLTAELNQRFDIMENYQRSPYLADESQFVNPPAKSRRGDEVDGTCEGLSCEEFGSD